MNFWLESIWLPHSIISEVVSYSHHLLSRISSLCIMMSQRSLLTIKKWCSLLKWHSLTVDDLLPVYTMYYPLWRVITWSYYFFFRVKHMEWRRDYPFLPFMNSACQKWWWAARNLSNWFWRSWRTMPWSNDWIVEIVRRRTTCVLYQHENWRVFVIPILFPSHGLKKQFTVHQSYKSFQIHHLMMIHSLTNKLRSYPSAVSWFEESNWKDLLSLSE